MNIIINVNVNLNDQLLDALEAHYQGAEQVNNMNDKNELSDNDPKYNLKGIQAHRSCDQILLDSTLSFNANKNKDSPLLTVKKLFVTNLADKATQEDLLQIFKSFGEVSECVIKKNRKSNYAFVTFTSVDSARNALKKGNGRNLHGKDLTVIPADPRHQPCPKKPPNDTDVPKKNQTDNSNSSGEIYPLIHKISDTCLMHIFQYLSIAERIKVEGVCRRWRDVSLDSWRTLKRLDVNSVSWKCKSGKIETSDLYQILRRCGRYITTITFFEKHRMMPLRTLFIIGKFCPNLKIAYLGTLEVTPREIDYLLSQCPNLEFLEFDSAHFRDGDFRRLFSKSSQLKYASVEKSKVDGSCFALLPESVETFVFHEAKKRTEFYAFESVVKRLKKLENLYLNFSNDSDDGLPTFEDDDDDDNEGNEDNGDYDDDVEDEDDDDDDDDDNHDYDYVDENDEFLDEGDIFNYREDDFHDEEDDFHDQEDDFLDQEDDFHDEIDYFHDEVDDFHDADYYHDTNFDFQDSEDRFDSKDESQEQSEENYISKTFGKFPTFKTANGKTLNFTTSSKVSSQEKEVEQELEEEDDFNSTTTDHPEQKEINFDKYSSNTDDDSKIDIINSKIYHIKTSDPSIFKVENQTIESQKSEHQASTSKSSENETLASKSSKNPTTTFESSENQASTSKWPDNDCLTWNVCDYRLRNKKKDETNDGANNLLDDVSVGSNSDFHEDDDNNDDNKDLSTSPTRIRVINLAENVNIGSLNNYYEDVDYDHHDNHDLDNSVDDYDDYVDDYEDYDDHDDDYNDYYDHFDYGFNEVDVEDDFIFESHLAETIRQTLSHCNTKLKVLQLKSCSFAGLTSEDLLTKITNFTNLERLDFSDNNIVNDAILSAIGANCPKLNVLLINRCTFVTDVGIGGIALLPELKHLSMNDLSNVTGKQLSTLCTLRTLYCARCPLIVSDGLDKLILNCQELEQLDIQFCKLITNSFIIDNVSIALKNRTNNIKLKLFAHGTSIEMKKLQANFELMEITMESRQEKFDSFVDGDRGTEKNCLNNGLELRDFRGIMFESSTFKEDKED